MYYGFDINDSLIAVLSEEELMEFSIHLEKFATKIKTTEKIKIGGIQGKTYSPKALIGKVIQKIELELIKREKQNGKKISIDSKN